MTEYKNLAIVWRQASRASDSLHDYHVGNFLKLDPTDPELDTLTRADLREVDEELLGLRERLPVGGLRVEVEAARAVLLKLYFVADEDDTDDEFDTWDGVTAPGLLWELVP